MLRLFKHPITNICHVEKMKKHSHSLSSSHYSSEPKSSRHPSSTKLRQRVRPGGDLVDIVSELPYNSLDLPASAKKPANAISCLLFLYRNRTLQDFNKFEINLRQCISHIRKATTPERGASLPLEQNRAVYESMNKKLCIREIEYLLGQEPTTPLVYFERTPLQHAIILQFPVDILDLLIENDADITLKDANGRTAAHIAASTLNAAALQLLWDFNYYHIRCMHYKVFNIRDKDGNTPIHYILTSNDEYVRQGTINSEIIKCLKIMVVQDFVDLNIRNNNGFTALDLAKTHFKNITITAIMMLPPT